MFVTAFQRLLRRLLDEASSEVIDAEIVTCMKAMEALSAGQRRTAEADLELLVELRSLIERYRRRSQELRALFETAGDLSSLRDVEGVLQAIVRRGRQLLNTDVAYLMLVDEERGDTYMRVTEGTTSPEFRQIRLPLGVGLGGRVAEFLAPHWTRNYLADTRYTHVIDGVVLGEELVAILGVPLKVGGRLSGVLFAADRAERDFSQAEVSLLSSLADHAAIAIENTQLLHETREALTALSSANEVIEANNHRLERAVALHESLMALVVKGGSVQNLADTLVGVIGGSVLILDDHERELARAATGGTLIDQMSTEIVQHLRADISRRSSTIEVMGVRAVRTPIVTGVDRLAWIVFVNDEIRDDDVRSLERAATIIAVLLLNRRAQDEADNRLRGEILAELLVSAPAQLDAITRRARLLEVDLEQELVMLVLLPRSGMVSKTSQAEVGNFVRDARGLVTYYADRIVMAVPGHDAQRAARWAVRRLAHLQLTIGASGPFSNLSQVVAQEDRARRAARLLVALGRGGEAGSADEFGIYGLLLEEAGQAHARTFVEDCFGPLRKYDEAHGAALMATLEAYFECETNVAEAAERLFVHVNTLYQRLDRLDKVLGSGWRVGDRAFEIRLALRLQRLLEPTWEQPM